MKNILVPIDFSEHSEFALEVAANIARKQDACIQVLHMMGLAESFLTKDETHKVFDAMYFKQLAKKKFSEFLNKDFLKDIEIKETIRNYKVFSEVNDVAKEVKAELIVMGSHGVTGFQELFIGSNTEKVIRTSEVPVLIVKKRIKNFKVKNAAFLTDFDLNSIDVFNRAYKLFELLECKLKLVYINLPEKFMSTKELQARTSKFLENAKLEEKDWKKNVVYYNDYSPERGIYNYCTDNNIDILGVATHGRKGLGHFFYGSMGEDIANHSAIPVLTLRI